MEDVLDVYHAPYDPQCPLICMDESNKQLVGEVLAPIAPAPGHGQIIDHEYVRNGVAEIFLEVEPLTGRRHVAITEHRTRKDWAAFIKSMLDERYPQATKVRLVYYTRFILLLAFWGTVGNSKLATRRGPPRGCDGPRRWSGGWRFSSSRSPDDTLRSDIASSPNANSVRSG